MAGIHICGELYSVLTDLLHEHAHLVELLVHALPVDDARLDDVIELEDDDARVQVAVEVIDVRRHAHRVHPVPVH